MFKMKMFIVLLGLTSLFFLSSVSPATAFPGGQEKKHDPIVEKVDVTNVEVPVRVLLKGKPVTGLTKDDFVLYENKKKMDINGFFVKKKTIVLRETGEAPQTVDPAPAPNPRTFVLVFNVTSYNTEFREAIDYLFANVLKPGDNLMVFANDKTRKYPAIKEMESIKKQLVADLKEESRKAKKRLFAYINRVETFIKAFDFREGSVSSKGGKDRAHELQSFLDKYLLTWKEYKRKYLTPKVDRFYYFSRYLEKLKTEKWVLNFYQFEFFPRIRINSRTMHQFREVATNLISSNRATAVAQGRKLQTFIDEIIKEHNLQEGFPTEEIAKLFYKVDATFHSIFIRTQNSAFLQDFEYKTVSSELEKTLKSITDVTGGRNISSTDLDKALETVSEIEDTYYILTYAPKNPKKSGALKIKLKGKKGKVLYDNNFRADYINDYINRMEEKLKTPDIKVRDFSFKRKVLAFTISDYLMRQIPDKPAPIGQMKVRIRIVDGSGNAYFDSGKLLTADKNEMKISIPAGAFKKVTKGEYNFLIDAQDMFTGKVDNFFKQVTVK